MPLRARTTLRSHCAKPSRTRLFMEIMRTPENTSMFVAAVNLMKSQSRQRTRDEDLTLIKIADPTAPENNGSIHGRGIYLMKALMDEVRFEDGEVAVHMRKSTGKAEANDMKKSSVE